MNWSTVKVSNRRTRSALTLRLDQSIGADHSCLRGKALTVQPFIGIRGGRRIRDMGPHPLVGSSFQAALEVATAGQIESMPVVQNEDVRIEVAGALSDGPVPPSVD